MFYSYQLRAGPVDTYSFCLKTDIFFFALTYRSQVSSENASFQKRSPEWRFLKTPAFRLRVHGRTKTEIFEYDDVIHHILLLA